MNVAQKVPVPGTGLELDTKKGIGGNATVVAVGTLGVAVLLAMYAMAQRLVDTASESVGDSDFLEV